MPSSSRVREPRTPTRIVGVGLAVVDHLLVVDDFGLSKVRNRYRRRLTSTGGMAAVALAQAARLGVASQLVSAIGDDEEGRWLASSLRRLGVGTRRLVRDPRFPTPVVTVMVHSRSAERRFLLPDRRPVERKAPLLDLPRIDSRTLLMLDGSFSRTALVAARRAREVGAPVMGDFADARPAHLRLLPHVDLPVVPQEFVRSWGRGGARETLKALRREFGGTPVVTLGARGALAWIEGEIVRIPPRKIRALDTTGAGDVFHGALAAGLCRGLSWRASLALASRAAARSCTALGGVGRLLEGPLR